ncbi:MAG: type II secretion system protein M [Pseudomonadota bacterium]|nr:type II secretion system protein M [Pseudomonadota bacterium]
MAAAAPLALPPALLEARSQLKRFWQARLPRERQFIAAMLLAVGILLVWLIAVQPALRTLREAPLELARLDEQMQQMSLAAGEMQTLRSASPVPSEQAATALRAATASLGDKAKLTMQGDRATLSFTGLPADSLRAWLGEARSAARARPLEAQLVKATSGYSGSVTLSVGGGNS